MVEFAINNKVYLATKVSLFIVKYSGELRIKKDIRKKEKVERVIQFVERMKKRLRKKQYHDQSLMSSMWLPHEL